MKNWILYEDNHLIIINKPAGIPVQKDKSGDISLLDITKNYIKKTYNKRGNVYLGLPHRIDRPTSGIVILSKTSKCLSRMAEIFREKQIKKQYWAIVQKKINETSNTLIHFLKKNRKINKSYASIKEKKGFLKAELKLQLIKKLNNYFLYKIDLISGRHHQIRAQLSAIGSPIKGDIKYGFNRTNKDGSIHLHSREVFFKHPVQKKDITITAKPQLNDPIWKDCVK